MQYLKIFTKSSPFLVSCQNTFFFLNCQVRLWSLVKLVDVVVGYIHFSTSPFFNSRCGSPRFMAMVQLILNSQSCQPRKLVSRGGVESEMWRTETLRNQITSLVHYSFIQVFFWFSFFGSLFFILMTKQEQQLRAVERIRREQRPSWRKPIRVNITSVFRKLRRRRRLRGLTFTLQQQVIILPIVASPDQPDHPYWHRQHLQEGLAPPVRLVATAITATNPAASGTWEDGTKSVKEIGKLGSTTRNGSASSLGSTNTPTFVSTTFSGWWQSIYFPPPNPAYLLGVRGWLAVSHVVYKWHCVCVCVLYQKEWNVYTAELFCWHAAWLSETTAATLLVWPASVASSLCILVAYAILCCS